MALNLLGLKPTGISLLKRERLRNALNLPRVDYTGADEAAQEAAEG